SVPLPTGGIPLIGAQFRERVSPTTRGELFCDVLLVCHRTIPIADTDIQRLARFLLAAPVADVTRGAGRSSLPRSCNRWPIAVATWTQRGAWWRDSEAAAASVYATTPLYIEHHAGAVRISISVWDTVGTLTPLCVEILTLFPQVHRRDRARASSRCRSCA